MRDSISRILGLALALVLLVGCGSMPLGKSDRALALGLIAVLVASGIALPAWLAWLFPLLALASFATIVNRVRAGLAKG